jgi:hypothetical protein
MWHLSIGLAATAGVTRWQAANINIAWNKSRSTITSAI